MSRTKGFTLIELLIVVAIIAILAAIAIPNLLQAQVRAKVSRAHSDMRSMATAVESYSVDFGTYPVYNAFSSSINRMPKGLWVLSTPIAYMGNQFSNFVDPFTKTDQATLNRVEIFYEPGYGSLFGTQNSTISSRSGISAGKVARDCFIIESTGPDTLDSNHTWFWGLDVRPGNTRWRGYDPSNGIVSLGDIIRIGGRLPDWFQQTGLPLVIPSG